MIKGVNKNMIEISNTENEYFERAILIVREDKKCLDKELLTRQANDYLADMSYRRDCGLKEKKRLRGIWVKAALFSVLGAGVVYAVVRLVSMMA
ncbi:hypothetical protein [Candidatus Soleaferrea massiliensis]|uniref:hypothetical protein n=1 Tax=Candidatus Soleaferrea massiliensis TaxID=1470354 RepID=UPI00058C21E4|nr:hypothetical protein [Candidatus Soleaferrea massiliensis]